MKLAHAVALAATWLCTSSAAHPTATPLEAPGLFAEAPANAGAVLAIVPFEPRARVNLDAVWWTAPHADSVARLAERFGMKEKELRAIDSTLVGKRVQVGQRVLVYRHDPNAVSRSIGAPNRGRLENAAPFPEGDGWTLRAYRPRTWATRHVVGELAASLTEWRERYPDAQPVLLGELARRSGGRARPHRSHRTGRDVDVGYALLQPPARHRFTQATPATLDAAATWGLVQRLIASGAVESIFMAAQVQAQLLPHAIASVDPAKLPAIFSVLCADPRDQKKALIRAWGGHDDHMHVRFSCTDADVDCRAAKRRRSKKKKRKGKRKRG